MKLKIYDGSKESGSKELPRQFQEEIRPDVIKRAVLAIYANTRQPYGTDPEAGKKSSSKLSRRRNDWKGSYGHGISRIPRKILSRSGTHFNWAGAMAPQAVGGRTAHPPKAEKIWAQKVNKKERKLAIRSALSATVIKDLVKQRGHIVPDNYPFIIDSKIEKTAKTQDAIKALENLGLSTELERVSKRIIRAGKGKMRGRKYKRTRGILVVVSEKCPFEQAAENIPGVEVARVLQLNAEMLAPGCHIGRMTFFTDAAVELLDKSKLFLNEKSVKVEKKETKKVAKK